MNAILALEDGTWFKGVSAGARGQTAGEVVFNTSMTGYQEVLTDPSYAGQLVTMTAPQIGNYGIAAADHESGGPRVAGFIVRDLSPIASNWRSQSTLREYLTRHGIVAIGDIDTRALTRKLRSSGVMRGVIATGAALDAEELVARARAIPAMEGADLVKEVTCATAYDFSASLADTVAEATFRVPPLRRARRQLRVAAYDYGIKTNILRRLAAHGCDVRVFPAAAPAADLLAYDPDGIFLSNGPGDPAAVTYGSTTCARSSIRRTGPSLASVWATNCSASPWVPRPTSSSSGIAARTIRSRISIATRSKSRPRTTGLP